jgi:histidine triad (HIT) family protein
MKDDNCIFCKIANGAIPSSTLYEDEDFRVILDLGPASRGHALILPKEHYADVTALDPGTAAKVLPLAARIGKAQMKGLGATAFNIVMNTGKDAGQTVFHFHTHVIPRYADGPAIAAWTPGVTSPEEMEEIVELVGGALDD